MGLLFTSLSLNLRNPYFVTTIIIPFSIVIFGGVGLYTEYPEILIRVANIFPIARFISLMYRFSNVDLYMCIINLFLWIIGSLCIYKYQTSKIKENTNNRMI